MIIPCLWEIYTRLIVFVIFNRMAIINGVDQERAKSINGIESELKLASREVVRLSRPMSVALQYDGTNYSSLKEDEAAKSVSTGWIYPVYLKRPIKVSNRSIKTGEVTDVNGRKYEFFWVVEEVNFGAAGNERSYNDFNRFKVEKVQTVTGYAVLFDPESDRLLSGSTDVTKVTPGGYFYPAYREDTGGLTELTLQSSALKGTFTLWIDMSAVTTGSRDAGDLPVFAG